MAEEYRKFAIPHPQWKDVCPSSEAASEHRFRPAVY
jgi:hypothetical protein